MSYSEDKRAYQEFVDRKLELSMARGKPSPKQLNLSMDILDVLTSDSDMIDGTTDTRNYGSLMGTPAAREFFAEYVGLPAEQVIVGGGSSLQLMYDAIARAMLFGVAGEKPWSQQEEITFLCPVPGYDRHFAICEALGIKMVNVDMTPEGPDMDKVEELVANDATIKGMWCVPKYSNPEGYTYSDETVKRLAALKPAAPDFRIFWDNAYAEHHLFDEEEHQDQLLNIFDELKGVSNPDLVWGFASTSKITFPGSGISCFYSTPANVAEAKKYMSFQTIGYDKVNQLRHVRYFKNLEGLRAHMRKQAEILRPKFKLVEEKLSSELKNMKGVSWTHPQGGYFVTFRGPKGTASRIVELCAHAGVTLTGAGAPFPYGNDPQDSVIRIAPTFPEFQELSDALDLFCISVRIAIQEQHSNGHGN